MSDKASTLYARVASRRRELIAQSLRHAHLTIEYAHSLAMIGDRCIDNGRIDLASELGKVRDGLEQCMAVVQYAELRREDPKRHVSNVKRAKALSNRVEKLAKAMGDD